MKTCRRTCIGLGVTLVLMSVAALARVAGQGQSPDELARSHYEIGMKFLQSQQYSEALKDFQIVVDSFPTSRVASSSLLEIARYQLEIAHDLAAAQTTTDSLIRKYSSTPSAAFAYVLNGRITLEKGRAAGDIDTAIASFSRVAGLYPGSDAEPSSIYYWGEALRLSRRNDEALERYRDLTLKYPSSIWAARASLGAASCLAQTGRGAAAMQGLQRLRTLFPGTPEAATALDWNTILYRLYVRAQARPAYAFSGRALAGPTDRLKDVSALAVDAKGEVFVGLKTNVAVFNAKGELTRSIPAPDLFSVFLSARGLPVVVRRNALQPENGPLVSLAISQPGGQWKPVDEIPAAVETSHGDWMVSDKKAKAVLLYSAGKYVRPLASGVEVERLALSRLDDVAMLDRENKTVVIVDHDGKVIRKIGPKGDGYVLENPVDLAFDAFGHLYILDREKAAVIVMGNDGKLTANFTIAEKSPGAFQKATALALDSAARLYIFDERAQHVQIYQ